VKSNLEMARRVERLYEALVKEGAPKEVLKHLWDAAVELRRGHVPGNEPTGEV